MIVKNESRIIERLIQSVLPIIDSYCICDTGSTDNTVEIIQRTMAAAGKPGEVIHESFRNFGYNRSFALAAADKWGDFALLLDADMCLVIAPDFNKACLTPDFGNYLVKQCAGGLEYYNTRIIKLGIGAKCVGPTHEYYDIPGPYKNARLETLWIQDIGDGGAKADKFERDVRLLKGGLEEEPNNPRYYFYLANSYRDLGKHTEAIEAYKKRIELGGWREEIFVSCHQLGCVYERIGDMANAIYWWLEAYNRHPGRAESLHSIAKHYRCVGKHILANHFCELGLSVPYPDKDLLFVQSNIYRFELDYENMVNAYYVKKPIDYYKYMNLISADCHAANLISNYKFYAKKLQDLGGVTEYGFNETLEKSVGGRADTFMSSTPCIIAQGTDGYIMNVRYVNYRINRQNGTYGFRHADGKITTLNKTYWLNPDLTVKKTLWLDAVKNKHLRYQGVEDVRIFEHGGKIRFLGTVEHPQTGAIAVGHGDYSLDKPYLDAVPFPSPSGRGCEKNWNYFTDASGDLRIIYDWAPLTICDATMTQMRKDGLVPAFFRHVRGSTAGVPVTTKSGARELWFLCHFVEYSQPRHYYHLVVILDANTLRFKEHSIPFKFNGEAIEYALGLVVEPERILFSYSRWDSSSSVISVPRAAFEAELFAGAPDRSEAI
jgi:glycosyltransferase involved in cell wall biosynthesis